MVFLSDLSNRSTIFFHSTPITRTATVFEVAVGITMDLEKVLDFIEGSLFPNCCNCL